MVPAGGAFFGSSEVKMATQQFSTMAQAREWAALHGLREKAVCFVVRGAELLVFDHVPAEDSGVQLPAGGVDAGETPAQAAIRELDEESGLELNSPAHLLSYEWKAQLPDRYTRQVCHAFAFVAPRTTPDVWQKRADEHLFAFRWAPVASPGLDWEMDAALPELIHHLQESR
jgi:8-oxo-dGTP diphosphatase